MIRLGWFSTGRGPGSRSLLKTVMDQKSQGLLDVDIAFVFCNWDNEEEDNPRKSQRALFFDLVRSYDIPLLTLSWKNFLPDIWDSEPEKWRNEYGKIIRELISPYNFDLGILAGYMLWVDDKTCTIFDMMNLHPALPDGPKGTWQEVIWQLISEDAIEHGFMMHLCTPEWDRGAALTYCRFSLREPEYAPLWESMHRKLEKSDIETIKRTEGVNEPLFKKIREDGLKRELPLMVYSIKQFADGVVNIRGQRLYAGETPLNGAFDLTREIDSFLTDKEF